MRGLNRRATTGLADLRDYRCASLASSWRSSEGEGKPLDQMRWADDKYVSDASSWASKPGLRVAAGGTVLGHLAAPMLQGPFAVLAGLC